jgi:hypothetical protein
MPLRERLAHWSERLGPLGREPWVILVPLIAAQWLAVAIFALTVRHNGWLYYQGGDQTWFYTSAWIVGHGEIPETLVGYAWAMALVPIPLVAGASFLAGLPALLVFQLGVLLPLALLCVYGLASRIGGRLLGYAAAGAWVVVPYAVIPLFVERYHEKYVEQFLPQALGLTGLGDFPSMVLLLASAYLCFRALDTGAAADAAAAGVVTGFAIGVKPSNGLFVFAPLLALAAARRLTPAFAFAAAIVPAVVTLTIWKARGTGISILAHDPLLLAAGDVPHPSQQSWWEQAKEYVPLDFDRVNSQFIGFREFFWSARLLEFIPLAGALAVARRSVPKALFLAAWLAAFFLIKGSSPSANVESGSFWRLLIPAWPAYFLLAASIPLLVPVWGPRLADRFPAAALRAFRWRRPLPLAAAALVVAVPLVLVVALPPSKGDQAAKLPLNDLYIPTEEPFGLRAEAAGEGLRLRWTSPPDTSAESFHVVYRSPVLYTLEGDSRPIRRGVLCEPTDGASRCTIEMDEIGRTRGENWDDEPPLGTWTYRIGLAANWRDDPSLGDTLVLSEPIDVRVR